MPRSKVKSELQVKVDKAWDAAAKAQNVADGKSSTPADKNKAVELQNTAEKLAADLRREEFLKHVNGNGNRALDLFDTLAKAANLKKYQYTDADVAKLTAAMKQGIEDMESRFKAGLSNPGAAAKADRLLLS